MHSLIFKTTALADEIGWFFEAALEGKMHAAKEGPTPYCIGSQRTPISHGLSEGYSHEDIACFYIARELDNDWKNRILENLNPEFRSKIEQALTAFRIDAEIEVGHVRKQPIDIPF